MECLCPFFIFDSQPSFIFWCVCVSWSLQDAEDKLRHDLVQTKGKLEETVTELTTTTSSYEQRILELNLAADALKRQKESALEKLQEMEIAKNEESKLKEQVMNQLKAASETLDSGQSEFQATKVYFFGTKLSFTVACLGKRMFQSSYFAFL